MTDDDFVKLWNEAAKEVRTPQSLIQDATSIDQTWQELNFDSLDMLMQSVILCDIYDLTEEDGKAMRAPSIREVKAYLEQHARFKPKDLEEALGCIR